MADRLLNVAFKVTWVYGEDGPWTTPCTPEGRLINILREGKVWCGQPECPCHCPHRRTSEPALDFPGETFRVLKDKEEKAFGEYRTRRLVLEAWERQNTGG